MRFTVTDTGPGISAADQARLFQPFQQAVDARPPEPGTGLGLVIAQRLVRLMDGELHLTSTLGQGSTFSFEVQLTPLALDTSGSASPFGEITGYNGPRRRVLIVDDVRVNRSLLRDMLAPLGFAITEADSGETALTTLAASPADLLLLDLRLPGIDGLELTRRLRAAPDPQPKVMLMSASVLAFNPHISPAR